ncbi:hypothetical protein [Paenisporosarcina antarctica]|nr:hypothetical protein [Paenisporosarcina antarctica]
MSQNKVEQLRKNNKRFMGDISKNFHLKRSISKLEEANKTDRIDRIIE